MKRIFAGSLCITKQKLYVVIFAALIVAALLITSIVLYTRNIVRIDESSMPAEISGLYPACYPMKCTINYADGTAVYSRYGSLFTIRGMSLDDYKEYMNDK